MASDRLRGEYSNAEVLSRVADFSGLAARFASVGKVRDLYRRVPQSPEGFPEIHAADAGG